MAYRLALHALEWLAVSAATVLVALAVMDASATWIIATGLALIGASAARGLSFRRAACVQFDAMMGLFRAAAPGRPANDRVRP